MQERLSYHVEQEMRSLSSIIKGERIRSQTVISLNTRNTSDVFTHKEAEEQREAFFTSEENEESWENQIRRMLKEAKADAERIIEEANQQKGTIINDALKEANQIVEKAHQDKEFILEEAESYKQNRVQEIEQEVQGILKRAQEEKQALIESTEGEMVETLLELLKYLVGEEIYHNTDWLYCIVKRMLSHEEFQGTLHLVMAPTVEERLTEHEKDKLQSLGKHIVLETDATFSDTTCQVITEQGSITYDVMEGLERVLSDIKILQQLNKE